MISQGHKMNSLESSSRHARSSKKATILLFLLLAVLILLAIQYVIGTYVNAYMAPPYGGAVFNAHYIDASLLVLFAIIILLFSVLIRNTYAIIASAVGVIFIAVAGQSGRIFASNGQDPVYSAYMALAFLIVFSSYLLEVNIVRNVMGGRDKVD